MTQYYAVYFVSFINLFYNLVKLLLLIAILIVLFTNSVKSVCVHSLSQEITTILDFNILLFFRNKRNHALYNQSILIQSLLWIDKYVCYVYLYKIIRFHFSLLWNFEDRQRERERKGMNDKTTMQRTASLVC